MPGFNFDKMESPLYMKVKLFINFIEGGCEDLVELLANFCEAYFD